MKRYLIILTLAVVSVSIFTSCHSLQTISNVEQGHFDTVRVETVRYDSIYRYHTHYIYQQGDTIHIIDTIYQDRYRLLWRDSIHIVHDTTLRTEIKTQTIERKLTIWQNLRLWAFYPLLAIALLAAAALAIRLRR